MELETFLADEDVVLGSGLDMQPLQGGAGTQSSGAALMVPASGLEEVFEPTEAELAAFLEDEEVALEIQSLPNILGCPSAWSSSEMIANANAGRQRVLAHREQEAVKSTPTPTPPEPEWLTAMSSSISSAAPLRSAQLASASAPRVHIVAGLAIYARSTLAQTGVSGPVVVDGESFLDALFASAGQG